MPCPCENGARDRELADVLKFIDGLIALIRSRPNLQHGVGAASGKIMVATLKALATQLNRKRHVTE